MKLNVLAAAALLAVSVMPAKAVTVYANQIGASGTTNIQGYVDINGQATSVPGLTASLYLQLTSVVGTTWNFLYNITNTSTITAARLSSWALGTTPNVSTADSTGLFDYVDLTPSFPNVGGAQSLLDFCVTPVDGNCSSGSGLLKGASAGGTLSLTFASVLSSITLDAALVRFQSVDGSTFGLSGASGVGFNVGDVNINPNLVETPLPGAVWLFGTIIAAVFGGKKLRDLKHKLAARRGLAFA